MVTRDIPAKDVKAGDVIHAWGFEYPVAEVVAFANGQVHIHLDMPGRNLVPMHAQHMVRIGPR